MNVLTDLEAFASVRADLGGGSLGLVPTMGALHEGHLALIRRSAADNEHTMVSVFVNGPQFNQAEDLERYPRALDADVTLAAEAGADFVFAPTDADIYPDGYRYRVRETSLSLSLEGKHRPGHFDGVLSVVLKLFSLVRPDRAYFGEKDYQQYLLIRGMAEAFFLPVEVIPMATIRDSDGLALSSRNALLSPNDRLRAAEFPCLLAQPAPSKTVHRHLEEAGFEVDYVEDAGGRRYGAVLIGGVRLIDNFPLAGH